MGTSCVLQKDYIVLQQDLEKSQDERASLQDTIAQYKEKYAVRAAKMKSLEEQVESLSASNTQLLSQVGAFTSLSQKKTENLEKSLKNMREKDAQIKTIQDVLKANDSLQLAYMAQLRNLSETYAAQNVTVKPDQQGVRITVPYTFLFGDRGTVLQIESQPLLEQIAKAAQMITQPLKLITYIPQRETTEQTLPANWNQNIDRANLVNALLQEKYRLKPNQILLETRGLHALSGTIDSNALYIYLIPSFPEFYTTVKGLVR